MIAIGTEIGEPVHHGTGRHWAAGDAGRKWIYIERDPLAIGVNRRIDVPLVGDLRDVVPQLLEALQGVRREQSSELDVWVRMHADYRAEVMARIPSAGCRYIPPALSTRRRGSSPKTRCSCVTAVPSAFSPGPIRNRRRAT